MVLNLTSTQKYLGAFNTLRPRATSPTYTSLARTSEKSSQVYSQVGPPPNHHLLRKQSELELARLPAHFSMALSSQANVCRSYQSPLGSG